MLLLLAIAGGFISAWLIIQSLKPLTERGVVTAEDWQRVEDESLALLRRRDRLLAELRDLEFEASLNKISGKDLEEMRARFSAEALELDKALEAQAGDYRQAIDDAVDARLAGKAAPGAEAESASEAPAAVEPLVGTGRDGLACGACGTPHEPDALFCDSCGAGLGVRCPDCDAPNRARAKFCKQCGHDLAAPVAQESA